jgi:chromosome segregation ATPase
MDSGLLPLLGALLGGGLLTAFVAIRKAPYERDSMRVNQADQIADGALALRAAELQAFADERERFTESIEKLTSELEALRRDRQHDRERCRQLTVANTALTDELDRARAEIARLGGQIDPKE